MDRSLNSSHGDIVIVSINGELMVKKLETRPTARLIAMNKLYAPIDVPEYVGLDVFGVAITVIHSLRHCRLQ